MAGGVVGAVSPPTGVVTFLLTDIVGSTPLWEAHRDLMVHALEQLDGIIDAAVAAAGGHLVRTKGEGDSAFAVFPRPSAAIAAAIDLQAAVEDAPWPHGIRLSVRVGVHTGEAHERGGDYLGPAVNRTARIRALAEGGQVLLSRATAELVQDDLPPGVALLDLGNRQLRGFVRDEQVFALVVREDAQRTLRETPVVADHIDLPLPRVVEVTAGGFFVARGAELDLLASQWRLAEAGGRSVVLVGGEPGIGKTRVACEAATRAYAGGGLVLAGRCDEDMGAPFQPFVEALAAFASACPPVRLPGLLGELGGELVRLVPELAGRCPGLASPMRADPETERQRLFEAVDRWLVEMGRHSPVLLLLDDLHWAAKPTLALLRHLARGAGGRLLVVATYRTTDLDRAHPLSEVLADLRRDAGVQRIALRGLGEDETVEYVEAVGGQRLDDRERPLAHAVHVQTEGNPFFLGEVLRHLVETGAVRREEGRWVITVASPDEAGLPEGVREVIGRRLSGLSVATNRVMEVGAVIGPSFRPGLLGLVPEAATPGVHVLDCLDEALRADILREDAGLYSFTHALIRQTVYAELTSARRTRLHRRVGEAIETLPDADRHVDALAHHFAEASLDGQVAKAADYGLAAARRALAGLGPEAAVFHLERALGVLDLDLDTASDPERRAALLSALAIARWALGDRDRASEAALMAAELARGLVDPTPFVRTAIVLTALGHILGGDPRPAELCQEALDLVGADVPAVRSRLLSALARYEALSLGTGPASSVHALEALGLARDAGDSRLLAAALNARLLSLANRGITDANLTLADELVGLAEQLDDVRTLTDGLHSRAVIRSGVGDVEGAIADAERLSELGRENHSWLAAALGAADRAGLALLAGEFDRCEALTREAVSTGQGDIDLETTAAGTIGVLRWHQGRHEEMALVIAAVEPRIPGLRSYSKLLAHGLRDAALGHRDGAQATVDALIAQGPGAVSADLIGPCAKVVMAETVAILGDAAGAAAITPWLGEHRGQLPPVAWTVSTPGSMDRFIGMLLSTQRRWDEAEDCFRTALELETRVRSPVFVANTNLWYGRMVAERGGAGDHERSVELLTAALTAAGRLGMSFVEKEARRLLAS
jgi:class 3 adenylate cyclase/tetratricopeptide (TPR) repeat protein